MCIVFLKFCHFPAFISSLSALVFGRGFLITWSSFTDPSKIVTLLVAYSTKNSGLCVTTITSLSLDTAFKRAATSLLALTSRFPVGSSARITGLSFASALAITVRCFSPPESLLPLRFFCAVSPTFAIRSSAVFRRSILSSTRNNASSTFSSTVRFSMILKSWKIIAIFFSRYFSQSVSE